MDPPLIDDATQPASSRSPTGRSLASGVLAGAQLTGVFVLLLLGFETLQVLVHPFNHIPEGPGPFGDLFRDGSRMVWLLPACFVSLAALERVLRSSAAAPDRPPGRVLLGLALALLLVAHALGWATAGPRLVARRPEMLVYGAVLPIGLVLGLAAHGIARRRAWLAFVAPGVVLGLAGVLVAWLHRAGFPVGLAFWANDLVLPVWLVLAVAVTAVVERRALGASSWTGALALLALWIAAVHAQLLVMARVTYCLCTLARPQDVRAPVALGVLWIVAVVVRLGVWRHSRDRRGAG